MQPSAAPVVAFVALPAVYGVEPHILPNRAYTQGVFGQLRFLMTFESRGVRYTQIATIEYIVV